MKKDTVFGIVALIWFLASVVGLFVVEGKGQGWLIPVIFGQVFLIMGIAFITSYMKSGNFKYSDMSLFLFPLIGLGCIIGGFIYHYGNEEMISKCERYFPYVLLGVFVLFGIFTLGLWYRNVVWLSEKCSQIVQAKCIDYRTRYQQIDNRREMVYSPVYQFYYNGNTYEVCNNVYSSHADFRVDEVYEIYIDPNKPELFYQPDENRKSAGISLLVGIVFVVFPIVVMVLYTNVLNGSR